MRNPKPYQYELFIACYIKIHGSALYFRWTFTPVCFCNITHWLVGKYCFTTLCRTSKCWHNYDTIKKTTFIKEIQIGYLASQDPFHFHSTNIHGKHFFVLACIRLCNINTPTGSSHLQEKQTSKNVWSAPGEEWSWRPVPRLWEHEGECGHPLEGFRESILNWGMLEPCLTDE